MCIERKLRFADRGSTPARLLVGGGGRYGKLVQPCPPALLVGVSRGLHPESGFPNRNFEKNMARPGVGVILAHAGSGREKAAQTPNRLNQKDR
jgi:hypothetical protein